MIAAQYYRLIYLALVTILTLLFYFYYFYKARNDGTVQSWYNEIILILLVGLLILFIGHRPESGTYFVDMVNYVHAYYFFYEGVSFSFDWDAENIIFDNIFAWVGSLSLGLEFFFTTIAAIYFGAAYFGIKKMFPNDALVAYLVFLGAFSTFSYGTNGIKAGAAASLFILAIAHRENLKLCIPLVLVSWGFHHSMLLPVAAFLLTLVFKNPKIYFAAWFISLLISAVHVTAFQQIFANILSDSVADVQGAEYLQSIGSEWGGKNDFRLDFVLYSAMPILVGFWAMYKKKMRMSKIYTCLLNIYLCTNGIWMLCMYASYTNRIAYLSWFMYPVLLIYPFLNEDWGATRYKSFAKVMLAHLAFTLFMQLVYY